MIALLMSAGLALYFWPVTRNIDAETIIGYLRSGRSIWWAPIAYVAAYCVLNLLFIPTQALSIAAVLLWGWAIGGAIELVAATVGAILPFVLVRAVGREWAEKRFARREWLADALRNEPFTLLLLLRLVPLIPYTLLNFMAGLTSIRTLPYTGATFLGMVPSTFIFAYFVDSLVEGVMRPREVVFRVLLAGVLLGALVVATRYGRRIVSARISRE